MKFINYLYEKIIKPHSDDETFASKELIFNILLCSFLILTITAFILSFIRYINNSDSSQNVSPYILAGIIFFIVGLIYYSKQKFGKICMYIFLILLACLSTYSLYVFGYILGQGLMIMVLFIVISGILVSSQAAFIATLYGTLCLIISYLLQTSGHIQSHVLELDDPMRLQDVIIYAAIFLIIYVVSWISSREINRSLDAAQRNERLLRNERDMLESRVLERTQDLERIQAEKTIELYRFAEFGKLSSSLVHDLASPLMAVSVNFDELVSTTKNNDLMIDIQEGINSMEQYVQSARRQLHHQQSMKLFNVSDEIYRMYTFLKPKADEAGINVKIKTKHGALLKGDSTRF